MRGTATLAPLALLAAHLIACGGRSLPLETPLPDAGADDSGGMADGIVADAHSADGWICSFTSDGRYFCTLSAAKGLPLDGSNWKCNQTNTSGVSTWFCYGKASGGDTPGGNGWTCTEVGGAVWKCTRTVAVPSPTQGSGYGWSCYAGSEFNGIVCEQRTGPVSMTIDTKCSSGDRMWCDGVLYSGWGQVECNDTTGTWKTTTVNGKAVLDCKEMSDGRRPGTYCACYHYFFNPACCERPDCVVPVGSKGQACTASPGKLCDYCNPVNQKECTEAGAIRIVTNSHETFCGRACDPTSNSPCPSGYSCMSVKTKVGTTNQCVPSDFSCYY